jgi:hypothetical protein
MEKFSKSWERQGNPGTEAFRTPNRHGQKRTFPGHIIVKLPKVKNKEIILKGERQKQKIIYTNKSKPIRTTAGCAVETLKASGSTNDVFQLPK